MSYSLKVYKRRKAWIAPGLLVLCAVLLAPGAAQAQSNRDINNRLNRLENELETLNRAVYKGETPHPGSYTGGGMQASDVVRLQQLESELQELRGLVEQQGHQIEQMQQQLDRALSDIDMRLNENSGSRLQTGQVSNYPQGGAGPAPAPYTTQSQVGGGSDNFQWSSSQGAQNAGGQLGTLGGSDASYDGAAAEYDDAFSLLKNAQYDQAETAFQAFISKYPDNALIGNAKYWLGETYYVRGSFEKAARLFAEGYQKYPKGPKAADNLLKLGMSLAGMGKTNDACVALAQLKKEFANGSTPVLRRGEQEMTRLKCSQ